ncbi:MAG: hypothetical protein ACIAQZ_12320 [Sedimentisphaeraceae bacterium JB056]
MSDQSFIDIEKNAASPKKVKGDSGEVEQHSLSELIEAEKFLASKNALKSKGFGVVVKKMVNGGI